MAPFAVFGTELTIKRGVFFPTGRSIMRTLFGIIVGAALTLGGAYLYDSHNALAGTPKEQALVNWDVVGQRWDDLSAKARVEWGRLSERARVEWTKQAG